MTSAELQFLFNIALAGMFLTCLVVAAVGFVLSFLRWERKKTDHDPFGSEERIRKQLEHHW